MIFDRHKSLLALVDALGGEVGGLDFQNLLFLYCREIEETPTYEFVPYKFGGFSFTSYADKRRLIEQGLLADEKRAWKLTPTGHATAKVAPLVRMGMDRFVRREAGGDEKVALEKVRVKYVDQLLKTDLHFFLGTTQEFHFWAPDPWVIIGVFPVPLERQGELF